MTADTVLGECQIVGCDQPAAGMLEEVDLLDGEYIEDVSLCSGHLFGDLSGQRISLGASKARFIDTI
jgi:hypothetical protein